MDSDRQILKRTCLPSSHAAYTLAAWSGAVAVAIGDVWIVGLVAHELGKLLVAQVGVW